MSNRLQLRVLLVITRLELPSNAVSPALTTITETPALYSHCTGVQYRGAGRISLILEQYTHPPSSVPSTPGRSHEIVFFLQPIVGPGWYSQSAQVDGGQRNVLLCSVSV